eukprot:9678997-Lingulodinium_polyedra.AAC.1
MRRAVRPEQTLPSRAWPSRVPMASHAVCGATRRKNSKSNCGSLVVDARTRSQTRRLTTAPLSRPSMGNPRMASASRWASASCSHTDRMAMI